MSDDRKDKKLKWISESDAIQPKNVFLILAIKFTLPGFTMTCLKESNNSKRG